MSIYTLRDSYTCNGDEDLCKQVKFSMSCKSKVVSPLYTTLNVMSGDYYKTQVSVFCGWETATSQIRLCISLCSLYATYIAFQAIKHENRKYADMYLQSGVFFSFLIVITAFFDFLAIIDSLSDNEGFCSMQVPIYVQYNYESLQCGVLTFVIVGALGFISGMLQVQTYKIMKQFRATIALDNL